MTFSLKQSLVALTVLSIGLLPCMLWFHQARSRQNAVKRLEDLGAQIWYESEKGLTGFARKIELVSLVEYSGETSDLSPLASLTIPHMAFVHAKVDQELVEILLRVPGLQKINLSDTNADDRALQQLAKIPSLRYLNVMGTKVSPEGVKRFHTDRPDCKLSVAPDGTFMLWLNRLFKS